MAHTNDGKVESDLKNISDPDSSTGLLQVSACSGSPIPPPNPHYRRLQKTDPLCTPGNHPQPIHDVPVTIIHTSCSSPNSSGLFFQSTAETSACATSKTVREFTVNVESTPNMNKPSPTSDFWIEELKPWTSATYTFQPHSDNYLAAIELQPVHTPNMPTADLPLFERTSSVRRPVRRYPDETRSRSICRRIVAAGWENCRDQYTLLTSIFIVTTVTGILGFIVYVLVMIIITFNSKLEGN